MRDTDLNSLLPLYVAKTIFFNGRVAGNDILRIVHTILYIMYKIKSKFSLFSPYFLRMGLNEQLLKINTFLYA